MTSLDEIRKRDTSYGDHIPTHYQAQQDRRHLLSVIDEIAELGAYVDGGVISWDMIEKALNESK